MSPTYHPAVPFVGKPRDPDVDEAISRVMLLQRHMAQFPDPRLEERAQAITTALEKGATLRELGKVLGVSPETVRKWGEMK